MKKQNKLYLSLILLGVILIGLGCGVSVFELSGYKMIHYDTDSIAAELPPLELESQSLEAPLTDSTQFKLDANEWLLRSGFDIQYDNTLQDKVLLQLEYPKELYHIELLHPTDEHSNYYVLNTRTDEFAAFRLALAACKDGYIIDDMPGIKLTLVMNEAQAKNFKLNEEQEKADAAEEATYEQGVIESVQEEYELRITEIQEQYQSDLTNQQENYDAQLEETQANYEEALQQKNEEIAQLQQQLDDVRNSLN